METQEQIMLYKRKAIVVYISLDLSLNRKRIWWYKVVIVDDEHFLSNFGDYP